MSYVMKNKKLFAVVMLVIMMSSVLVLPASALLNYGMGGVSFTDSNGVQYGEGYIWNDSNDVWSLYGRLECDYPANLILYVYASVDTIPDGEELVLQDMDSKVDSTWASAGLTIDRSYYYPIQASADFYIDEEYRGYSYPNGWNHG